MGAGAAAGRRRRARPASGCSSCCAGPAPGWPGSCSPARLSVAVVLAASAAAGLALLDDRRDPLGAWALLVSQEWLVLFAWPLALAYAFPDGRLPSARWRPAAGVAFAACAGAMLLLPFQRDARRPVRAGRRTRSACTSRDPSDGAVLDVLGRRADLAVRRRARAARPLPRRRAGAAAAGPLGGLRRAVAAALARRLVAGEPGPRRGHGGGPGGPDAGPRLARGRRGRGRHAARALCDRPPFNRTLVYALLTALLAGTYAAAALLAGRLAGGSALAASVGDARRRAGLPAAARPPAARRRPPLRPRPLRGRPARRAGSSTTSATGSASPRTSARCSRSRSGIRARRCCSACPRPARTRTASAGSSPTSPTTAARVRRSGATAASSACCCTIRRSPAARPAARRARRRRGRRGAGPPARASCASSSPRWSPRARGSPRPATPSGAGSSATSTTAPSSGS